jgi:hypothetical protein
MPDLGNQKELAGGSNNEMGKQADVSEMETEAIAGGVEQPPEPFSLARKIQELITALPVLSAYSSNSALSSSQSTSTPTTDANAATDIQSASNTNDPPPIPAPPVSITDSRLISLLSSATIMNGSLSKGRQSVWSVLDRLRSSATSAGERSSETSGQHVEEEDDDDNSSVMMYAPLQPDANSEVEVARSEICSIDEEGEVVSERSGEIMNKPHTIQNGEGQPGQSQSNGEGKGKNRGEERNRNVKEVRVWIPSTEKVSLQATWWGYRL